ncbi:nuclease-related domain-containing protein [Paraburkholderia guartelaensis]|uniref:nuclease-related domain-containing protein n=1 Tax=Paraburkholderia guartelaensis TaxID=2546446 RepID=UPI002AB6CACE|nr:nuclease-related domain-containing protein [Paraburkholderia guartelaensis]
MKATRVRLHGETVVLAELRRVLWLRGDNFHMYDVPVLDRYAPGKAVPSAEIDLLAETPLGIFVIETKNWGGSILPGAHRGEFVLKGPCRVTEPRRSSVAKNRNKVAFLNETLLRLWADRRRRHFRVARVHAASRPSNCSRPHRRAWPSTMSTPE